MTADPRASIERLRERLDESDDISDADAEALRRMTRQIDILGPAKIGDHSHEKYLMRCVTLAEWVGGLADALEDRTAAEELVAWINTEKNNSPETNKDYRVALRQFGKHATDGDGIPDNLSWVPGGYPSNYDPQPDPAQMLDWDEDIEPMLKACHNPRDRALVSLAFDGGPRSSELHTLAVRNITDGRYGLKLSIEDGKTGSRTPTLQPAIPYVNTWLDMHPANDDPTAPLWCQLSDGQTRVTANRIRDSLKEIADRADVTKPVTPTNFRKSSASFYASRGLSQPMLEQRYGWKRGSDQAARYVAIFGDASEREIARIHGVDVEEDEPDPIGPIECDRCGQLTARDRSFCMECGAALDPETAAEVDAQEQRVRETLAMLPEDKAEAFLDVVETLDSAGVRSAALPGDHGEGHDNLPSSSR